MGKVTIILDMSKYPEIRIKDGWLLRMNASVHLHKLKAKKGEKLADDDEMANIVDAYNGEWKKYEKKILKGMYDLLGLQYRQNIIDVYIAPWFGAFSDPLVIGVGNSPDEFVDTLAHELLHRLFTDNTSIAYQTNILKPEWEKMFGKEHTFGTLVHIPVHAVSKAIYLDVLKEPRRLERDVKWANSQTEWDASNYVNAWDYVEKNGYSEIIKKLKISYEKLSTIKH